jgi:hypothetical protein
VGSTSEMARPIRWTTVLEPHVLLHRDVGYDVLPMFDRCHQDVAEERLETA